MIELRPYQRDLVNRLMCSTAPAALMVVSPTGSGKTVTIIGYVVAALERNPAARVLILSHRREIVHQTIDALADFGIDAGVILAGEVGAPDHQVQVGSLPTLWTRRQKAGWPKADILVLDEAHHARARTYRAIVKAYSTGIVIGLTATPVRGDGRGLGNVFEKIIEAPQV